MDQTRRQWCWKAEDWAMEHPRVWVGFWKGSSAPRQQIRVVKSAVRSSTGSSRQPAPSHQGPVLPISEPWISQRIPKSVTVRVLFIMKIVQICTNITEPHKQRQETQWRYLQMSYQAVFFHLGGGRTEPSSIDCDWVIRVRRGAERNWTVFVQPTSTHLS